MTYLISESDNKLLNFFQRRVGVGSPTALHSNVKWEFATPMTVLENDDIFGGTKCRENKNKKFSL